jgi:hypothetical protein
MLKNTWQNTIRSDLHKWLFHHQAHLSANEKLYGPYYSAVRRIYGYGVYSIPFSSPPYILGLSAGCTYCDWAAKDRSTYGCMPWLLSGHSKRESDEKLVLVIK